MNKKFLMLSAVLLFSTPVFSLEATDRSGHSVYVGFSQVSGGASDLVDGLVPSFGYDYTTGNSLIFGGYIIPELISVSSANSFVSVAFESSVVGLYTGIHDENNFRITSGLNFISSAAVVATNAAFASGEETRVGFDFGVDYLKDNLLIGVRLSTYKISSFDGVILGVNIGYQF